MADIKSTGTTQFKVYFTTGDNDDLGADINRFYSRDASNSYRPKLVIEYYVPEEVGFLNIKEARPFAGALLI